MKNKMLCTDTGLAAIDRMSGRPKASLFAEGPAERNPIYRRSDIKKPNVPKVI